MIYVVSGYRRSGTSAMMNALGVGGIPLLCIPDQEVMNVEEDGYKINPGKLYEITRAVYMTPNLLGQVLKDGCAVKIFFDGLPTLPAGDYRIIYMRRDPVEIQKSLETTNRIVRESKAKVNLNGDFEQITLEVGGNKPFDIYSPYCQQDIDWVLGICSQRNDMDVSIVNYHDLVNDPEKVLESLGLPIDVKLASNVIKPEYYRVRG